MFSSFLSDYVFVGPVIVGVASSPGVVLGHLPRPHSHPQGGHVPVGLPTKHIGSYQALRETRLKDLNSSSKYHATAKT